MPPWESQGPTLRSSTLAPVYNQPLAYFITFRTYGTWLHGEERGSVDRLHNKFGEEMRPRSRSLKDWEREQMVHEPVVMDIPRRAIVDKTLRQVCEHKGWKLLALNARTNHVHVVVTASERPERVMTAF